jgi:NAD-dependent DNA ligase
MSFNELCASLLEGEPTSPYPPAPPPSQEPQTPDQISPSTRETKMASKAKSTSVYVIVVDHEVHSAFATLEAANAYIKERGPQGIEVTVQTLTLEGGSITLNAPPKLAKSAKPTRAAVAVAANGGAFAEPAKPEKATPAPAVENGTASSSSAKPKAKGKSKDDKLPDNVKELLNGEGGALNGQSVMITGTFPKLGRKNIIKLVENYGGDLKPELRKSTNLVVIGDDLGSKK